MSEYRQDRANGSWVIIAPERGHRPRLWYGCDGAAARPGASVDPTCPFCPGNEHLLPAIIESIESPEPPGWLTRVVPNKYPALRPENGPPRSMASTPTMAGYGYHEVIIESGRHNAALATLAEPHRAAVIQTYQRRYAELMARPAVQSVTIFRNHGQGAGASLAHPHAQAIAAGMTPPRIAAGAAWAHAYYTRHGRCATCAEVERELQDGKRVVRATERFLVLVPFAAASPFEQWIIPRQHQSSFAQAESGALIELGRLLQWTLSALITALDDPPYNFAIVSAPATDADTPYMHWGLRIVPDLATPGGFELAAGLPINPSRPEDDAEVLRTATAPLQMDAP